MSVTQQQAKDSYGGVKVGSAFLGFVTSIGMIVLLTAVLAALGLGLGGVGSMTESGSGDVIDGTGSQTDWYLGVTGVVVILVVLFLAYLSGGYVAGRMARFHGARQGLAVWLWALLVAVALTVVAAVLGGQQADSEQLTPLVPSADELGVGAIGLGVVAVVTLLGAVLGGLAGMRFHRRVDRLEADVAAGAPVRGTTDPRA